MFWPKKVLERKLIEMVAEDVGQGDITTVLLVPAESAAEAEIIAKDSGIAAGIEEARILLESMGIESKVLVSDGGEVRPRQRLIRISGNTRTILCVERTLLNIISRMSGIATTTRKLVNKLEEAGFKTKVACTRKTAPGLLYFDKKAVSIGGGDTHRFHLDDMILIKDNHIALAGGVEDSVKKVLMNASFSKKIEVEVTKAEDALKAARAGADIIMVDNFTPKQVNKTVKLLKKSGFAGRVLLEASGGIVERNILSYASSGVDVVSLGEITQNVTALDVSLEITRNKKS